ncbi:Hypothetical predicted protein [Olea europaea subsp. europaea]|uniref:Uncharacterized protein n=1 Tax=Olea europaea subsp. europaea TaxID=158383 RepID=A0A8S0TZU7_OLEEU|nr:Hypothetical predicted protein [Olea europaea subsp. europaea]
MLAAQSPFSGGKTIHQPKNCRKPLQPVNSLLTPITTNSKSKPNHHVDDANKENVPPIYAAPAKYESFNFDSFDASLNEELNSLRVKLERMRTDEEKTEKMMNERNLMLDLKMKELLNRGESQNQLEIEVDRLYRLQEIKLYCMRVSSLRSLREKENEKRKKQDQIKASVVSNSI